jgi:hypothetical protein
MALVALGPTPPLQRELLFFPTEFANFYLSIGQTACVYQALQKFSLEINNKRTRLCFCLAWQLEEHAKQY